MAKWRLTWSTRGLPSDLVIDSERGYSYNDALTIEKLREIRQQLEAMLEQVEHHLQVEAEHERLADEQLVNEQLAKGPVPDPPRMFTSDGTLNPDGRFYLGEDEGLHGYLEEGECICESSWVELLDPGTHGCDAGGPPPKGVVLDETGARKDRS